MNSLLPLLNSCGRIMVFDILNGHFLIIPKRVLFITKEGVDDLAKVAHPSDSQG